MQGICDAFLAWYTPESLTMIDKDLDWILLIAAWATSAELELSVQMSAVACTGDVREEHWVCSSLMSLV